MVGTHRNDGREIEWLGLIEMLAEKEWLGLIEMLEEKVNSWDS